MLPGSALTVLVTHVEHTGESLEPAPLVSGTSREECVLLWKLHFLWLGFEPSSHGGGEMNVRDGLGLRVKPSI